MLVGIVKWKNKRKVEELSEGGKVGNQRHLENYAEFGICFVFICIVVSSEWRADMQGKSVKTLTRRKLYHLREFGVSNVLNGEYGGIFVYGLVLWDFSKNWIFGEAYCVSRFDALR